MEFIAGLPQFRAIENINSSLANNSSQQEGVFLTRLKFQSVEGEEQMLTLTLVLL